MTNFVIRLDTYLDPEQKADDGITGHELLKRLSGRMILDDNVLDYLLANPHLIPEDWKGKYTHFLGTFHYDFGHPNVRYLYWALTEWASNFGRLEDEFTKSAPIAVGKFDAN